MTEQATRELLAQPTCGHYFLLCDLVGHEYEACEELIEACRYGAQGVSDRRSTVRLKCRLCDCVGGCGHDNA